MAHFLSKLFRLGNKKSFGNTSQKGFKNPTASSGFLNEMPENVLYGEDSGAVPSDDLKNSLEEDIH